MSLKCPQYFHKHTQKYLTTRCFNRNLMMIIPFSYLYLFNDVEETGQNLFTSSFKLIVFYIQQYISIDFISCMCRMRGFVLILCHRLPPSFCKKHSDHEELIVNRFQKCLPILRKSH